MSEEERPTREELMQYLHLLQAAVQEAEEREAFAVLENARLFEELKVAKARIAELTGESAG